MGRKKVNALDAALQEGWSNACQLYEHLANGGQLTVLPPSAIRLNPDEVPYSDAVLGYSRYYGKDVTYDRSSMMLLGSATFVAAGLAANAIGNANAKNQAMAEAAVQWRDHANVRVILTNQRLLCDYSGQWLSFWHEGIVEFQGAMDQWLFVLRYEVGHPIMLHGPAAAWYGVSIAHLVYGPRGLQLPGLAPLAHSVSQALAQRQQAISGEIVTGPGSSGQRALPPA
ncbi:MAG: hypothetical protein ACRDTU_10260 [Micromonosporaceae bacterium]